MLSAQRDALQCYYTRAAGCWQRTAHARFWKRVKPSNVCNSAKNRYRNAKQTPLLSASRAARVYTGRICSRHDTCTITTRDIRDIYRTKTSEYIRINRGKRDRVTQPCAAERYCFERTFSRLNKLYDIIVMRVSIDSIIAIWLANITTQRIVASIV